jgi:hypothetical protein
MKDMVRIDARDLLGVFDSDVPNMGHAPQRPNLHRSRKVKNWRF